jgi:hypothetical protein
MRACIYAVAVLLRSFEQSGQAMGDLPAFLACAVHRRAAAVSWLDSNTSKIRPSYTCTVAVARPALQFRGMECGISFSRKWIVLTG